MMKLEPREYQLTLDKSDLQIIYEALRYYATALKENPSKQPLAILVEKMADHIQDHR